MRISVMVTHGAHNPKFTVQVRGSQPKKCECITSINGKQHRSSFRVMFYTFTTKKENPEKYQIFFRIFALHID